MIGRSPRPRRTAGLLLAVLLSATASPGRAQQPPLRSGQTPGPRFIIPTLRSDAGALGFQAARAVRERIASDFDMRALWVVPESTITAYLIRSGYPADKPLTAPETRQLASAFRAEEFINGSVSRTSSGAFRIQADWALGTRSDMVQPLPVVEAAKISDLAKLVSNEFQAARRQVEFVRRCMDLARARNYSAALAEARKAIAAYPRSVFGRVCIANIYDEQKLGPDSMIRVSREILEIHPENQRALAFAADAYGAKGSVDDQIAVLITLRSVDPSRRVVSALIRSLATAKRYMNARPLVDSLAEQNPGDVEVAELQWLVRFAMQDWSAAVDAGLRLFGLDSAAATRDFHTRMATAAQEAGNLNLALGFAARGSEKYPADDDLPLLRAQLLRRTGNPQAALGVLNGIIVRNPRVPNAWTMKARVQFDLKLGGDSVAATLRGAVENGTDRGDVSRLATSFAGAFAKSGTPDTLTALRTAIRFYKLAENLQARDSTAYYLGVTSLTLAQQLAVEARSSRRCDAVKEMQAALVDAQVYLMRGGRAFPRVVPELLERLPSDTDYGDRLAKALCR